MKFLSINRLLHIWSISILPMLLIPTPSVMAVEPIISTTGTVANGASSPVVYVDWVNIGPSNDKFDFTVDV